MHVWRNFSVSKCLCDQLPDENLNVRQIVYVRNFCVTNCLVTNSLWRTVLSRIVDVTNCPVMNSLSDKMFKDEMPLRRNILWRYGRRPTATQILNFGLADFSDFRVSRGFRRFRVFVLRPYISIVPSENSENSESVKRYRIWTVTIPLTLFSPVQLTHFLPYPGDVILNLSCT